MFYQFVTTDFIAIICSGPVAQHPPIICAPKSFQSFANSANLEGE